MHFVLVKFVFSKKAHYRQPKNTWLAQTMDRDRSLSKLELGIPGWMVGKSSILRRTNSLLACHCLFVSQCPLKDSTQLSRCGFWQRNSETTSPLSAAITANTQKLLREVQTKKKVSHTACPGPEGCNSGHVSQRQTNKQFSSSRQDINTADWTGYT